MASPPAAPRRAAACLALAAGLALAACGARPPGAGVEPDSRATVPRLGVAALIADRLRVQATDGWSIDDTPVDQVGWEPDLRAGRIAAELLAPLGGSATPLKLPEGTPAAAPDWAARAWRSLDAAGALDGLDAVLVLRQNAIGARGQQYSPVPDFIALGLMGVAIGAATREERFQQRFVLVRNTGLAAALEGGEGWCAIGIDAALLDARTGRERAASTMILGREAIPRERFASATWQQASAPERAAAEAYCMAALRRAVSQAIKEVGLVAPR